MAADRIRLGEADVMIGAGTESMSMIPMGGNKIVRQSNSSSPETRTSGIAYGMGITAEKVAEQWKIRREAQDEFATESHRQRTGGDREGRVQAGDRALYPQRTTCPISNTTRIVHAQQGLRNRRRSARRHDARSARPSCGPRLRARGSVTAGNSSQTSDGAGAVILMSEAALKRYNLQPLGRFLGFAVAGVPPEIMGIGPKFAIPKVLEASRPETGRPRLDRTQRGVRRAEPGGDRGPWPGSRKVNPLGGAIALGPSAGRHRRDPHGNLAARPAPAQAEVRHGDDVHRHGNGCGGGV